MDSKGMDASSLNRCWVEKNIFTTWSVSRTLKKNVKLQKIFPNSQFLSYLVKNGPDSPEIKTQSEENRSHEDVLYLFAKLKGSYWQNT